MGRETDAFRRIHTRLREMGFKCVRQNGSHMIFHSDEYGKTISITYGKTNVMIYKRLMKELDELEKEVR